MEKLYKLVYHFKDGSSWLDEAEDLDQSTNGIVFLLNHFQKSDKLEITLTSTNVTRKVNDIKSIEIIF